jgi:type IV secretion system protein VirB10
MKKWLPIGMVLLLGTLVAAQSPPDVPQPAQKQDPPPAVPQLSQRPESPGADSTAARGYTVPSGTRVPLLLINSISTRSAHEGDQVYLETAFPIVVSQKIVIPAGSYVRGTITQVKRPGRVAGRGEMYLRFDSLTLPNGVTRDFKARVGAVDGSGAETLDKKEGKIQGDTSKGTDVGTVASTTATGTGIGAIAGSAAGRPGLGTGVGAAGGALAGLATVLLTRGPDVQLLRGTELDMILDRALVFAEEELNFQGVRQFGSSIPPASGVNNNSTQRLPTPLPRIW